MNIKAPKGTKDIFGEEAYYFQKVEQVILEVCKTFNIEEIRTPMFESTDLFIRGVGDTTDIVNKEMYTFNDKGGRSITLKPESTAAVSRAYIEHGMHLKKLPVKLFYLADCFRYENTQADRYRQFKQFGVEYIGTESPFSDAELIAAGYQVFKRLGLTEGLTIQINSLGGHDCRKIYNDKLRDFLKQNESKLCETCKIRADKNPLRVLDCKESACQKLFLDAPLPLDCLSEESILKFEIVKNALTNMHVPFEINKRLVRGLDYYTNTVVEFNLKGINGAVLGGGRYDGLVEELGGAKTPAVGFAMGMERIVTSLIKRNIDKNIPRCLIYLGSIGDCGNLKATTIANNLREDNIVCESDILGRSVKSQLKYANSINAKYTTIIGLDEINKNICTIKNMDSGEKQDVSIDNICDFLKNNKE